MKSGYIGIIFFIVYLFNEECRCSRDFESYKCGVRDQIVLSFFNKKQESQRLGTVVISLSDCDKAKRLGDNRYELEYHLKTEEFKTKINNPLIIRVLYQRRVRLLSPTQGSIYEYKIDSICIVGLDCPIIHENKGWLSTYETNRNVDAKIFL